MELLKGMFGSEFNPKRYFGLSTGQYRGQQKVGHNNGWYNKFGEKLGWGDISAEDLKVVQKHLEPGQLFITLGERDSYWHFVSPLNETEKRATVGLDDQAPGPEYVAAHFRFAVMKDVVFARAEYGWNEGTAAEEYSKRLGMRVEYLSPEGLLKIMKLQEEKAS